MSFFARPESPPPRQPSPEPVHTPLPSPHMRARDRASRQLRPRASSPLVPPGLAPPRTLVQSRSCDQLSIQRQRTHILEDVPQHHSLKRRVRSNLGPSTSSPSGFTPASSPNRSPSGSVYGHRRTLSVAVPYRSPPPSPTLPSPVPPVPPIPDSARSSPMYKSANASACSSNANQSIPVTPIYLPDLHELSPVAERRASDRKSASLSPKRRIGPCPPLPSPSAKQHRSVGAVGMTCLKFFSLRNSTSRLLRSGTSSAQ